MAMAQQFEYVKPHSVAEAVKLLARRGAQVLAGGTDLIGLIADDAVRPETLVDIKGIAGLDGIELKKGAITIGALVTFNELRSSAMLARKFPVIGEMAGWVASAGVRNRATLAGNLCSAVPCCDSGPVLLAYDAVVLIAGARGKRKLALSEWFLGPRRTALKAGEIVTGVALPLPPKKHAACFVKLGRYRGEDLAQASVAVVAFAGNRYRVAFGAVAPRPIRGHRIEALLAGRQLSAALMERAVQLLPQEITPITDIRATREYRAHMAGVMLERGLQAAVSRLRGKGPAYGTRLI